MVATKLEGGVHEVSNVLLEGKALV